MWDFEPPPNSITAAVAVGDEARSSSYTGNLTHVYVEWHSDENYDPTIPELSLVVEGQYRGRPITTQVSLELTIEGLAGLGSLLSRWAKEVPPGPDDGAEDDDGEPLVDECYVCGGEIQAGEDVVYQDPATGEVLADDENWEADRAHIDCLSGSAPRRRR